ncbi:uncharacterized protein LOC111393111 [Olea europaea var. sylvestris]|uniref:uncharacterized protein LOC111393111 n=1 Tax=Olea europaea var. sylvestris TaxID=158386 RepID=UPI000C1CD9E0|nr:uncharacterized protein LOC111393111 [Olea europaea var. sylvestris]
MNIVGSKWVFRNKYLSDKSIDDLKALKASTVRVAFSLAITHGWPLRQLDVKNTFLNGTLQKHVNMEQFPSYVDPRFPHHLGFTCNHADPSVFVLHPQQHIIYHLLYVDDIVLTGNNASLLNGFIRQLHSEFATKDLGSLSYFLGLEVTSSSIGLFLSQTKYTRDILARAQLLDCKPMTTPMAFAQRLSSNGPPFVDVIFFCSLVGALQYLTITRPDFVYLVNSVSQYLHAPTNDHFQAVKHILQYVKGTLHFSLMFTASSFAKIIAYSDADWAGCPDTQRSTSGYSIYLGDNLVSWSAKKQPTVSRSSCELEYRALAPIATEVLWLEHLLRDLCVSTTNCPLFLCDNKSAVFLSSNPVTHKRSKHIALDYHFLRELVVLPMSSQRVFRGHSSPSFDPSYVCALIPCLACGVAVGVKDSRESSPNSQQSFP